MKLSVIPLEYSENICNIMTSLIDIPCLPLKSYLSITLSPSNPTMHPSRLFELFNNYNEGVVYNHRSLFYEEWGNLASQTLLNLDEELLAIFNSLNVNNNFNPNDFEKIKSRYNITEASELTYKIRTAPGFQTIKTPMIAVENGFIPDLNSRYFIEDLQYGLCIIKAFAEICNVKTPTVDKVTSWAQNLLKKEYLVDGKLIGKDVKELVIPQNNGITTKEELIKFYI